jgi:hypothetical protein
MAEEIIFTVQVFAPGLDRAVSPCACRSGACCRASLEAATYLVNLFSDDIAFEALDRLRLSQGPLVRSRDASRDQPIGFPENGR